MPSDVKANTKTLGLRKSINDNKTAMAGFVLVSVLFIVIAAYFSSFHAFWSSDCGARFAMVRNFVEHGSLIHLYYPARSIDPTGQINPLFFYLYHRPHSFVPQYEPLFPLLSALPYRFFGFFGLLILPLICGVGTLAFIYASARRLGLASAKYVPAAVGMGTPVIVYSVVYWDHSAMMLVAAAACWCMLRGLIDGNWRWTAAAGAILGAGVFIHELVIGVFASVLLAAAPFAGSTDRRRHIKGLIAGFAPFAVLWVISNLLIYGDLLGPHIVANMGGNQAVHKFHPPQILSQFVNRAQVQLTGISRSGILLTGQHLDLMNFFLVLAALLFGFVLVCFYLGVEAKAAPLLWLAASSLSLYLVVRLGSANGLFEATPLFIPALGVRWWTSKSDKVGDTSPEAASQQPVFLAWVSRTCWIYAGLSIADPILPGIDWGSRYLLPVLPLLSLLSCFVIERQITAAYNVWRQALLTVGVAIAVMSICSQCVGLSEIGRTIRINHQLDDRIARLTTPAIVYYDQGLGPQASAVTIHCPQFVVQDQEDWNLFLKVLTYFKCNSFTFVGTEADGKIMQTYTVPKDSEITSVRCSKLTKTLIQPPNCPPIVFMTFDIVRQMQQTHLAENRLRRDIGRDSSRPTFTIQQFLSMSNIDGC